MKAVSAESGSGTPLLAAADDPYSATQLRADRWSALQDVTQSLSKAVHDGKSVKRLRQQAGELLHILEPIEPFWAFPGNSAFERLKDLLRSDSFDELASVVRRIVRATSSGYYRRRTVPLVGETAEGDQRHEEEESPDARAYARPYFETLFVDNITEPQEKSLRSSLHMMRRREDPFIYEPIVAPSLEDAIIAVMVNYNIQAVVVRFGFDLRTRCTIKILTQYLSRVGEENLDDLEPHNYGVELCRLLAKVRPELDVYLVTDRGLEDIAGLNLGSCRRVFYNSEDFTELHLNVLRGVSARYETPFFNALKAYSQQPTGVFHAMPISRGKSIARSHWIQDMGTFYGPNIFLAETSATSGGLDSLLEPSGPIKRAQELAARAFGAKHTYFATNGTSTCNKIVVQALIQPGDIVLVDRDCHKSHHYGLVLAGAEVVYLDSYPLHAWSMYGAVPLHDIKKQLLDLRDAGHLDRVRMLLLTNCTFDGIVYNVERVMQECLAIKPDLVFLWDEAWFAFARFSPTYRQRTAMHCADMLRKRYRSEEYREAYNEWAASAPTDRQGMLETGLLPDPDKVRVRVYATQSTHKTLTALRQGSMIHVHDQDFKGEVEQEFREAYMTHTSTSPNYQIIASLDVGRRQVELEGFEFVQKQIEAAMVMRRAISSHSLLKKYFKVLAVGDMVPGSYRSSGIEVYWDDEHGWNQLWDAWVQDEFVIDPTRITLTTGHAGIDGNTFKNQYLMDKYGIQINKTSRNTVLFMTNIGTTRSSVAYLIEVLVQIARELDSQNEDASSMEQKAFAARVHSLTEELPSLPDFSRFHDVFRSHRDKTPAGDLRAAYFYAYDESRCEYFRLHDGAIDEAMANGRDVVSSGFIIPYPPGFPILVPGQVISSEILDFMRKLDVKEIHGYRAELGLRVFTEDAIAAFARA